MPCELLNVKNIATAPPRQVKAYNGTPSGYIGTRIARRAHFPDGWTIDTPQSPSDLELHTQIAAIKTSEQNTSTRLCFTDDEE